MDPVTIKTIETICTVIYAAGSAVANAASVVSANNRQCESLSNRVKIITDIIVSSESKLACDSVTCERLTSLLQGINECQRFINEFGRASFFNTVKKIVGSGGVKEEFDQCNRLLEEGVSNLKLSIDIKDIFDRQADAQNAEQDNADLKAIIGICSADIKDSVEKSRIDISAKIDEHRNESSKHFKDLNDSNKSNIDRMENALNGACAEMKRSISEQKTSFPEKNPLEELFELGSSAAKQNNLKKAIEYWREAAIKGHAKSMYYLGLLYSRGEGVEKDTEEANYWYRRAGEEGNVEAQYLYGVVLAAEMGEDSKAMEWFKKAADKGHVEAQNYLGIMNHEGYEGKDDYFEAAHWYRRAADQGHMGAMYDLGCMYFEGDGVDEDSKKAEFWLEKAAEKGHEGAQYKLGCMCRGKGDLKEAKFWFQKAAEKKHTRAQGELDILNVSESFRNDDGETPDSNIQSDAKPNVEQPAAP